MSRKSKANYPDDVASVIDAMSFDGFSNVNIVGSASQRDMLYSADYDCIEKVVRTGDRSAVLNTIATQFQAIIRRLLKMKLVFIGDIKIGEVPEWNVLHSSDPRTAFQKLYEDKIVSKAEYKEGQEAFKTKTEEDFFKFHILRWKPADVLKGELTLRNGVKMSLAEALEIDALFKLDVVSFVQGNRFTDFSIIYELFDGSTAINPMRSNIKQDLLEDVRYYMSRGHPFKALKRAYSLAIKQNQSGLAKKIRLILNSPLGALYQILSDMDTIVGLLDSKAKVPIAKIRFELDQFRGRMGYVYGLADFEKAEPEYLMTLMRIKNYSNKKHIAYAVGQMAEHISQLLASETLKAMKEAKLAL